jgi:hypothetical protein
MVQKSGCAGRVQGGARPHKYCAHNGVVKQTLVCPRRRSAKEVRQIAGSNGATFAEEPDPERRFAEHVLRPAAPVRRSRIPVSRLALLSFAPEA